MYIYIYIECHSNCLECNVTSTNCVSCDIGMFLCPITNGSNDGVCVTDCDLCMINGNNTYRNGLLCSGMYV